MSDIILKKNFFARMNIDRHKIITEIEILERVSKYNLELESRTPSYCAGCPHRGSSSVIMELRKRFQDKKYMRIHHNSDTIDIISHGGIGCYSMNFLPPFRDMHNMAAMGMGGAAGAGAYPFTKNKHYVMCGDSTFFHSEMSTLSNAIKDNQDILYLILDNKNTAMTGHQVTAGSAYDIMGYKTIQQDIESVVRGMDRDGKIFIRRIDPAYRAEYMELLEDAFLMNGIRVIIADRECGITYHRKKKEETRRLEKQIGFLREEKHINISEEVCENCRECTINTGCPGLTICETPYGEKIAIDQSICVDDKYCTKVKACPSFEQVVIHRKKKPISKTGNWDLWMKDIPKPSVERLGELTSPLFSLSEGKESTVPELIQEVKDCHFERSEKSLLEKESEISLRAKHPSDFAHRNDNHWTASTEETKKTFYIFIPGVGGMGLGFIAKLLTEAGAREGYHVNFYHQKGLAQRNGAVVSHVLFSTEDVHVSQRIPDGKADLILGLDYLETVRGLHFSDSEKTSVICNTAHTPTIKMLIGEDAYPTNLEQRITAYSKSGNYFGANFFELAEYYLGNRVYANLMMLGAAYQKSLLPIHSDSIESVISESVKKGERENNLRAFRIGRRLVSHPEMLHIGKHIETLENIIAEKTRILEKRKSSIALTFRERIFELLDVMKELLHDAKREFVRRYYDLIWYENITFAEEYAKRVLEVYWVESERKNKLKKISGIHSATEAVIWNLYKVMAIKDEVWVAHLLTCDEKIERDRRRYNIDTSHGDSMEYIHINRPQFDIFGKHISWDMKTRNWMLNIMKRMKFLRRMLLSWHRENKSFRDWYQHDVINAFIEGKFDTHEDGVHALQTPASCTGYRDVVYPKYEKARQVVRELLNRQSQSEIDSIHIGQISMN